MKYFKTFESFKTGVNGVGSLKNSLARLKKQKITSRLVDEETLAQAIYNEYEAITDEKYKNETQMANDDTITDIVSYFKLDGSDFLDAWGRITKK